MYLRLTTFTKILPQMSFHLYILLFLFRSGAPHTTLLTAGAFTDTQLPVTASNACRTDARLGGVARVAPQTKILATPVSGCMVSCPRRFLRWPSSMLKTLQSSCHHFVCYSPLRLLFMVPVCFDLVVPCQATHLSQHHR